MNSAISMYALGLDQIHNAILKNGNKRTVLIQGHMGTGKSSLLKMLGKSLTNHTMCYFDCTTKDLGDVTVPKMMELSVGEDGTEYVRFVPNEELGLHFKKPIILMIDEYGKANPAVKNAMLRLMLEGKVGSYELHPQSLKFATTNLGAEGVGDLLPAHARNRVTVVTSRKPTWREWVEWGINNGVDPIILGWARDNEQIFQSFEDIKKPTDDNGNPTNPYVYHPKVPMTAFVTPRSLEAASDWVKLRADLDDQTLTAVLMGTIGERAAMDVMAFVRLADQLPSLESIKKDPTNAKVPTSAGAVVMVIDRALGSIERDWMDAWMDYLVRLDREAQGMFVNTVRGKNYAKQNIVLTNKKFTDWAMKNNDMFTANKR